MNHTNDETIHMIDNHWKPYLEAEFAKSYMKNIKRFLQSEKSQGKRIYPHSSHWFAAFEATDLPDIKVVILGQDPYHGAGMAHGLCFSVPKGVDIPPSLRNIYQEIQSDIGCNAKFVDGDLTHWATQGVFLLNSVLTVEHAQAGSHAGRGWELFTDRIIQIISKQTEYTVFMLWGAYAQKKIRAQSNIINNNRHLILQSPHPSPLAAHRGFFGCRHFSQANAYLQAHGKTGVDWR